MNSSTSPSNPAVPRSETAYIESCVRIVISCTAAPSIFRFRSCIGIRESHSSKARIIAHFRARFWREARSKLHSSRPCILRLRECGRERKSASSAFTRMAAHPSPFMPRFCYFYIFFVLVAFSSSSWRLSSCRWITQPSSQACPRPSLACLFFFLRESSGLRSAFLWLSFLPAFFSFFVLVKNTSVHTYACGGDTLNRRL